VQRVDSVVRRSHLPPPLLLVAAYTKHTKHRYIRRLEAFEKKLSVEPETVARQLKAFEVQHQELERRRVAWDYDQ